VETPRRRIMESDPELEAIRARIREQMAAQAAPPPAPAAPRLDHPVEATDATFQRLVDEHPFLVVDCWAPWCGPCRILGPIVDELAREMAGTTTFAKLNVDDNPRVAQAFGVQSIPTLLVFREGRLVDRLVGVLPKPALRSALSRHGGRGQARPGPRR
jgi:thioredoxin 1